VLFSYFKQGIDGDVEFVEPGMVGGALDVDVSASKMAF